VRGREGPPLVGRTRSTGPELGFGAARGAGLEDLGGVARSGVGERGAKGGKKEEEGSAGAVLVGYCRSGGRAC
jgi:hypothetical protein